MISKRFVLDDSLVLTWCFTDECNEYSQRILEGLQTGEALVPAMWPLELGNYEVSYLELAMRMDLAILTNDARFLSAAEKCNVPVYNPIVTS